MRTKTNENIYVSSEQTIDRSRWVFGNYKSILGISTMLNEEGNMCCLGQICYNSGVGTDALAPSGGTIGVLSSLSEFLDIPYLATRERGVVRSTALSIAAMCINDSGRDVSLAKRESQLKVLFKKHGITLKFKGKYPKEISNED